MALEKYIEEYENRTNQIIRCLSNIKSHVHSYFCDDEYENELNMFIKNLRDERFQLLVIGEFSRGKSTLINALIGRNLIPSSKNPTTATLNLIKYGIKDKFVAKFYDGRSDILSHDEFKKLIACENGINKNRIDPKELAKIEYIEIHTPNEFGKLKVDIIDTPGVNDLNREREKITFNYLKRAHSAIIVLAANELLSASEMDFIQDKVIKESITKFFIAINFKDDIKSEKDQKRIFEDCVRKLDGIVPRERIFLVSAKEALNYRRREKGEIVKNAPESIDSTGFPEFEASILKYLSEESGRIKIQAHCDRIIRMTENFLEETVDGKISDIESDSTQLKEQIEGLKRELEKQMEYCQNCLNQLRKNLLHDEEKNAEELRRALLNTAQKASQIVESYNGNDPEELLRKIRKDTFENERIIQQEMPERHKQSFLKQIEETVEKIRELCPDIPNRYIDYYNVQPSVVGEINPGALDAITYKDISKLSQQGSGLSADNMVGGAMVIGFLAGGILGAFVAGYIASAFVGDSSGVSSITSKSTSGSTQQIPDRDSMREAFMKEIRKEYYDGIEGRVKKYRDDYNESVKLIIQYLSNTFESSAENKIKRMQDELKKKQTRQITTEEEIKKALDVKNAIKGYLNKIKEIRDEFA